MLTYITGTRIRMLQNLSIMTSDFHYDPTQGNLMDKLFSVIDKLGKSKFLCLSVDVSITNWNVPQLVDEMLSNRGFGSCSLHIFHGGICTGIQKTNWNLC